ncbi:MAG: PDZ domain-containing protein [Planctomycetota bacterium]
MKPHALRRILQVGCLATAAGVVAAGSHLFVNVRPATAAWVNRPGNQIEQRWRDMAAAYDADGRTLATQGSRPQGPVSIETVTDVYLRYKESKLYPGKPRDPFWFPFVGPEAPAEKKPVEVGPKPPENLPTGLETIGKPVMVLSRTLLFQFNGHESDGATAISVGDFIRYSDMDAKRFRLVALEEAPVAEVLEADGTRREIFGSRIVYETLDRDGNREGELRTLLLRPPVDPKLADIIGTGGSLVPLGSEAAAGTGAPGTPGAVTDGTTPGTGSGEAGPGTAEGGVVEVDPDAQAITVATELSRPVEELTQEDLRPQVIEYSETERAVVFDRNTYEYIRSRGQAISETVKTEEYVDGSGRVVGIRVTGFGGDAPVAALDVKKGDILKSINGRPVTSRAQAIEVAQTLREDQLVTVVIERRGRDITYKVDPQDPRTRRNVRYFDNLK